MSDPLRHTAKAAAAALVASSVRPMIPTKPKGSGIASSQMVAATGTAIPKDAVAVP